ncbi:MAG: Maf family nucleotide pyrophosphatase [Bacteroidales bacterium]
MLRDKLRGYRLILASSSPRRKLLFEGIDLDFTVETGGNIAEDFDNSIDIKKVPEYLAELKSKGFPRKLENNEILITADTMVLCNNEILGKPKERDDAIKILTKLSGNKHQVLTSVYIRSNYKSRSFTAITDVYFRELSPEEIDYYIDNYAPYDKAGAYGAQEWIGYIAINRIEGSYFNVMGLPIHQLYMELEKFLTN